MWPSPCFRRARSRHSTFYVRTDRGIHAPPDLAGKRIGLQEYQMTAAVVVRGFLGDEYGMRPGDMSWSVADVDPTEPSKVAVPRIPGVDIKRVHGRSLDELLVNSEVDAVIALRPPASFVQGNPLVARLFPDWRKSEQDYFARTRFFPIMHAIGVKHALVAAHPWLPTALYRAFFKAKEVAWPSSRTCRPPR